MTPFPGPDREKLRRIMSISEHIFYAQPTLTHSQEAHDEWTYTQTPCSDGLPSAHMSSPSADWPMDGPRGLGVTALRRPIEHTYYSIEAAAPANDLCTWLIDWPMSYPQSPGHQPIRDSPWSHGCDPMSTLLPTSPACASVQRPNPSIHFPTYDTSPSPSDHSTMSALSSPYAHSDGYRRPSGSPLIKLEGFVNLHTTSTPFGPDMAREQPLLVNPVNLVVQAPQQSIEQYPTTALLRSASAQDGSTGKHVKPDGRPTLPSHRRAYSADDMQEDMVEDRQKRGFTKLENAICSCTRCGKLFQRNYNLNKHMETHDPHRVPPYACSHDVCSKRFMRRTDLLRHQQSVHVKTRIYKCTRCDGAFARKDTLRRHVDDGCSKRPQVKKRVARPRDSTAVFGDAKMFHHSAPEHTHVRAPRLGGPAFKMDVAWPSSEPNWRTFMNTST